MYNKILREVSQKKKKKKKKILREKIYFISLI